jgi:superfamily II RNA helicase
MNLTTAFLMRAAVLQVPGYLDPATRLTDAGRWAMRLRHPRLLVLAELVHWRQLPTTAPRLAGIAAALGTERPPRAGGTKARLAALSHVAQEVARLERVFGLEPDPIAEEFKVEWNRARHRVMPAPAERRAEVVEAWARGAEWLRLTAAVEAEEGDLQRTILQAAEVLMQLEGLPFPPLRALAHEAREALLRPPVV